MERRAGQKLGQKSGQRYRRTLFCYFMIIVIVPVLILGCYAYYSAEAALRKNIRQANETELMQIENKVDNALDVIRQEILRIASSRQVVNLSEQYIEEVPYPELRNFIDELIGGDTYISYMSGYSFINFKKQWVLSNKGTISLNQVNNKQWVDELRKNSAKIIWSNRLGENEEPESLLSEYINNHYLTFIVKPPIYTENSDVALIFNLKQSALEALFHKSIGNGSLIIFDQDGKLVYSENNNLSSYYLEHQEILEAEEMYSLKLDETEYDIVKKKSAVSGWTFIAAYDASIANKQLMQIPISMFGIISIILMIHGIISGLGAFRVYKPIESLVKQLKGIVPQQEEKEEGDEFSLIHNRIHRLVGHNEELQDMIQREKGQLSELFAIRLMRGRLAREEIEMMKERLGLRFGPFLCVISVLFCQNDDERKGQMEQDLLNLQMLECLRGEIGDRLLFPPFIHTRAILISVDGETREQVEEKILTLRNQLSVLALETCGGYVDMGVSRLFTEVTDFKKANGESLEALKVNEYSDGRKDTEGISVEDSCITYYEDLMDQEMGAGGYNLVLDSAMKEAIDTCNLERALLIVEEFLQEMSRNGAVLYEQHYYQYRFLLTILSVPVDAGIPINDLFPKDQDDLFQCFNQLYDVSSIRKFYETQVIVPVINKMSQFRKSNSEVVMEKIMNLVKASGGDLTLTECAEKLGYHPSYIWRIMKQTKDITFTDYIAEQKLELAKKMLLETDLSIAEIAERLSYSNAQNFIRLFKKHLDVTPGQFRKTKGCIL